MVTARLAHVIRYITPGIEEQHGTAADDQDRFRRRAWRLVPVTMTGGKSKPPSGGSDRDPRRRRHFTLAEAADAFLSSPRAASPNTRRAYAGVIDRLVAELGPHRPLAAVPGDEIAAALRRLWGNRAPSTWNRNRAAVVSWLTWCATRKRWPAPQLPGDAERRKEHSDRTRALPRARIERLLSRDIPLREKTLWRMLYETAARASEILALNVEDLDLEQRRAPIRSKGGDTEFVYWDTGTAHLLPRLLRLPDGTSRTSGPLFLASRRPVPARRSAPRDICPHTGRARLGYDRARVLFKKHTATATSDGLELHQLRHFVFALFPCSDSRRRWASGPAACAFRLPSPRCRLSRNHVRRASLQQRQANCDTGTTEHGECGNKPLRSDPPRRPEGPAPADHGQDSAQVPAHRHALRQTRRRGRRRGHQPARPAQARPLSPAALLCGLP
jgi:integrase